MLNKKVVLPWGLFALTAMYAMMRPCTTVDTKCNSTVVLPVQATQVHVVHAEQVHSVAVKDEQVHSDAVKDEQVHSVTVEDEQVHSVTVEDDRAVQTDHAPVYVHPAVVHHVRHRTDHIKASDEHPSTVFVMSVTLLTYAFIKVVFVPPRGYKKYI